MTPKRKCVISDFKSTCYKDGNGSKHPVKPFGLRYPPLIRNPLNFVKKCEFTKIACRQPFWNCWGVCLNAALNTARYAAVLPAEKEHSAFSSHKMWMDLTFLIKHTVTPNKRRARIWGKNPQDCRACNSKLLLDQKIFHRTGIKMRRTLFICSFSFELFFF